MIRQYAEFVLYSNTLTASDITSRLGVEADEIMIRGSETLDPPVPRHHLWSIRSEGQGLSVDAHLEHIIDRLGVHANALGDLVLEIVSADHTPHLGSVLRVVRHFDDPEGEEEVIRVIETPDGGRIESLPGQHQLLGWHLEPRVIDFLWATHASLDFCEYG